MREIKFRVWNKFEENFVDSDEYAVTFNGIIFKANLDSDTYNNLISNENLKIMQYTGLKDKNGVDIYEGDICRCWGGSEFNGYYEYNKIYEVKWQGSGLEMMIGDCGYGWNYSSAFEHIKVIGNIYENPELLKEKR